MPDTRGRTSATRVGAMRPGSSRIRAKGSALTVTMPTSGGADWGASADAGSSHAASTRLNPTSQTGTNFDDRLRISSPTLTRTQHDNSRAARARRRDRSQAFPDLLVVVGMKLRQIMWRDVDEVVANCHAVAIASISTSHSGSRVWTTIAVVGRRRMPSGALAGGAIGRGLRRVAIARDAHDVVRRHVRLREDGADVRPDQLELLIEGLRTPNHPGAGPSCRRCTEIARNGAPRARTRCATRG